jgi:outer membrane receptor for ferrienterochelin and colicins
MINGKTQSAWRNAHLGTVLAIGMGTTFCVAGLSTPARAQSMDYGSLEKLFGEPVTTSATGSPQRASDVPANMEIITAADIRRSGADNIPDILQFVAGVDVRRYGAAQAEVSIRGYNQPGSPRLLVLINGRQVYLDDYGRTSWQSLPVQIDEIRQIEIVKGPNSALYGFNAVGGVINIITYDPLFDSANTVTVRGGTQQQVGGSAVVTLHDGDKAGLRLSAGGSQMNEFSTASLPSALGPYNRTPYQFAFSADGRIKLADNVDLSAAANVTEARSFDVLPSPVFADDTYRTNSLRLEVAADTHLGLLDLTAYRNELNFIARTFGQTFPSNNSVYVLKANDLFKISADHTLLFGLEYRDNFNSGPNFGGKVGDDVYAPSAMWNWQITPELTLTNAIRLDYLTLEFAGALAAGSKFTLKDYNTARLSEPSYNSGFVYKPTDNDTFRLLASHGIQAPSLTDFGIQLNNNVGGVPLMFAGNPNLKAASVENYEIDYDRAVVSIGAMLRTAIYYQRTDNLLTSAVNAPLVLGADGLSGYSQNIGSSSAAGGEIGLKSTSDSGMHWNFSYALITIADRLTLGPLSGQSSVFDYGHGAPASVVDLGAGYGWDRVEIDAQARWQSRFTDYAPSATGSIVPFPVSNYVTMNARVGYHVTDRLTLTLAGAQLGQSRLFEAAGTPVERRVTVSLTDRF